MSRQAIRSPAIDIDMLTMALQAGDLDTAWWLDTHSGDVIPAPEDTDDDAEQQLIEERERNPQRYIVIEPIADSVHLELMESFIATREGEAICEMLYESLKKKQPAWHFKNALSGEPQCEDDWYAFKEQFYALQARQWLRDRLLDYKEVDTDASGQEARSPEVAAVNALTCLEVSARYPDGQRRYVIWQQHGDLVLTLFSQKHNQEQQLSGELSINKHQLDAVNHILETYRIYIDPEQNEQAADVHMKYHATGSSGELSGALGDEPFRSLILALDMLLGVPSLKA